MTLNWLYCILALLAAGCTKVPPTDDGFVTCTLIDRIGSYAEWRGSKVDCVSEQEWRGSKAECVSEQEWRGSKADCVSEQEWRGSKADCVSEQELNADLAVQIALLHNPAIQATFEELGIAHADLIEAGLLSNPVFGVEIRFPRNIEYLITSSLLDLFLVPLRTKLSRTEFEQTKIRVAHEILTLAFTVRESFYELVAATNNQKMLQSIAELAAILSEISLKQSQVGNINLLEVQLSQARFLEAEAALSLSHNEVIRLRVKLNRLLGFSEEVCLILPENLPEMSSEVFQLCQLEATALTERLDLQVARFEIVRLGQMLGLKQPWSYTQFRVGLAGEQDSDGKQFIGPGFSGEIPLFNYGQAARLRLYAQLRQAQDLLAVLEIQVLSEVREAYQLLENEQKIQNGYRNRLLPLQRRVLNSSEALYNVMGLGVDKLLEAKQREFILKKEYTESLKRYWVAKVRLERALGGHLSR